MCDNNAAQVGSSTWNNKQHPATPWAGAPGLTTAGLDYDPFILASQSFAPPGPAAGTPVDFNFAGNSATLTALIQNWQNVANAGLLLFDPNENSLSGNFDRIIFDSREATNPPQLIVEFAVIPEPSSALLLGIGLVGLVRIRRRRKAMSRKS